MVEIITEILELSALGKAIWLWRLAQLSRWAIRAVKKRRERASLKAGEKPSEEEEGERG